MSTYIIFLNIWEINTCTFLTNTFGLSKISKNLILTYKSLKVYIAL